MRSLLLRAGLFSLAGLGACKDKTTPVDTGPEVVVGHGPIAAEIRAPMGEALPYATASQLETYERGRQVALRRFDYADGLGPAFNVTFCGSCHEKPVLGGAGGLY